MNVSRLNNYKFNKLETNVIKELIEYSKSKNVESARILKSGKNITDEFLIIEDELKCNLLPISAKYHCEKVNCKLFDSVKKQMLMKDATYIHYHPKPLPLSFADVFTCLKLKLNKMIAVTEDGMYSIFIPNSNIQNNSVKKIINANRKLVYALELKGGTNFILNNKYVLFRYKTGMDDFWKMFAKETDSIYISNM